MLLFVLCDRIKLMQIGLDNILIVALRAFSYIVGLFCLHFSSAFICIIVQSGLVTFDSFKHNLY